MLKDEGIIAWEYPNVNILLDKYLFRRRKSMKIGINSNWSVSWDKPQHFTNLISGMGNWVEVVDEFTLPVSQHNGQFIGRPEGIVRAVVMDHGFNEDSYLKLVFLGKGTISIGSYSEPHKYAVLHEPGDINFHIPKGAGACCIWFSGDNIESIMLTHDNNRDSGVWNPSYIDYLKSLNLDIFRTMNLQQINKSIAVDYTDLATASSISFETGVPHIHLCELAKILDIELHIHIPTRFSPQAVADLAQLYKDNYPKHLKLHVEYSNESWNYGPDFKGNSQWARYINHTKIQVSISKNAEITSSTQIRDGVYSAFPDKSFTSCWMLNTGTQVVVENNKIYFGGKPIEIDDATTLLIVDNNQSVNDGDEMLHAGKLLDIFNGTCPIDKIYATQNAAPQLAPYKYGCCKQKPTFNTLLTAPYYDTSILAIRVQKIKEQLKVSVYSSNNEDIFAVVSQTPDIYYKYTPKNVRISAENSSDPLTCPGKKSHKWQHLTTAEVIPNQGIYYLFATTAGDNAPLVKYTYDTDNLPDGDFDITIFEDHNDRLAREKIEIDKTFVDFKENAMIARNAGMFIGTYEGGPHNMHPFPDSVLCRLQDYYNSTAAEESIIYWMDQVKGAYADRCLFYKEMSSITTKESTASIFGLCADPTNPFIDGRYRAFSRYNKD